MRVWIFLAIMLTAGIAIADDQAVGIGSTYWSNVQSIGTTSTCLHAQDGTTCQIFPAGEHFDHRHRITLIEASAAGRCCVAGVAALAIGTDLVIDDGSSDGQGACWNFGANGGVWAVIPSRKDLLESGAAGMSTGLCTTPVGKTALFSDLFKETGGIYLPCRVNGDCTGSHGTVCNGISGSPALTSDQLDRGGVIINCRGESASVAFFTRKERVKS